MAVPKRKTTPSKRNMRRSHDALKSKPHIIEDANSGEHRLSHHVCLKTGLYRGKKIIINLDDQEENDNHDHA